MSVAAGEVKQQLKRLDMDGSDLVTKDKLFVILKALDFTFTKEQLDEMLNAMSMCKNGKVEVNKLIDWCMGSEGDAPKSNGYPVNRGNILMKGFKLSGADTLLDSLTEISELTRY